MQDVEDGMIRIFEVYCLLSLKRDFYIAVIPSWTLYKD